MTDEDELLSRVRLGDTAAIAEYAERLREPLLGFVMRSLGPKLRGKVEPEDILQETSLTAVRTPAEFAAPGREPFRLLCQIAEQRIIDAHRRYFGAQKRSGDREVSANEAQAGNETPLIDMLVASMTSASRALSRNQREARLWEAIDSLPEEQRQALRLRYVDGLPTKDIAERLGKTDGAIRVLLSRTLDRLQRELTDSG